MTVTKTYKVWFDGEDEASAETYEASNPNEAAEERAKACLYDDGDMTEDSFDFLVREADGKLYEASVEVEWVPDLYSCVRECK